MRTHTLRHAEQGEDEARYHNSYILARVEEQVISDQDLYHVDIPTLPEETVVLRPEPVETEQVQVEFIQLPPA